MSLRDHLLALYGKPIELECTGRDGQKRSFHAFQDRTTEWTYRFCILPLDEDCIDFFEFTCVQQDDDTLRVTVMDRHQQPVYSAKGIPEGMIELCATGWQKVVTSSSNATAGTGEFRSPSATKIWERLKANGRATFDSKRDRYSFILNNTGQAPPVEENPIDEVEPDTGIGT